MLIVNGMVHDCWWWWTPLMVHGQLVPLIMVHAGHDWWWLLGMISNNNQQQWHIDIPADGLMVTNDYGICSRYMTPGVDMWALQWSTIGIHRVWPGRVNQHPPGCKFGSLGRIFHLQIRYTGAKMVQSCQSLLRFANEQLDGARCHHCPPWTPGPTCRAAPCESRAKPMRRGPCPSPSSAGHPVTTREPLV